MQGQYIFSVHQKFHTGSGAQPTPYSMDNVGLFPGLKLRERKFDKSPPSNAGVKNEWICTSNPPVRLHGVYSDRFTFRLLATPHS